MLNYQLRDLTQVKLHNGSLHDAEVLFRDQLPVSYNDLISIGMCNFASAFLRKGSLLESEHMFRKIYEYYAPEGFGDREDFISNLFQGAERHLEFGNLSEAESVYRSSFTIDDSMVDERLRLIMLLSEWALDYGYDSEAVWLFRECFDVAARGATDEAYEELADLGDMFRAAGLIDLVPL